MNLFFLKNLLPSIFKPEQPLPAKPDTDKKWTPHVTLPPVSPMFREECELCQHVIPANPDMWPKNGQHCMAFGKNMRVIVLPSTPRNDGGIQCGNFTKTQDVWIQVAGEHKDETRHKCPYPASIDIAPRDKPCATFCLANAPTNELK